MGFPKSSGKKRVLPPSVHCKSQLTPFQLFTASIAALHLLYLARKSLINSKKNLSSRPGCSNVG